MASTVALINFGHSKSKDEPASTGSRISVELEGRKPVSTSASAMIVLAWGCITYNSDDEALQRSEGEIGSCREEECVLCCAWEKEEKYIA